MLGTAADRRAHGRAGIDAARGAVRLLRAGGQLRRGGGHERISRAVAELALLPALRAAAPGTEILADGFSCRTQIEFLGGRRAQHLAEVLADRLDA